MMTRKDMWTVAILCIVLLFIGGILGTLVEARRATIRVDETIAERGEVYAGECFDQRKDLRRILRETKKDLDVCEVVKDWKLDTIEFLKAENAICLHDLGNIRSIVLSCSEE